MVTMPAVRLLLAAMTLMVVVSGPALAVTPEELGALARAGLGDEVLLALIESTGVDRAVDAEQSVALKRAGVSDRVIAAAVRASHRAPAMEPPAFEPMAETCPDCQGNVAVIGATPSVAVIQREVYYLPWIWAVPVRPSHAHPSAPYLPGHTGVGRFINDGFVDRTPRR